MHQGLIDVLSIFVLTGLFICLYFLWVTICDMYDSRKKYVTASDFMDMLEHLSKEFRIDDITFRNYRQKVEIHIYCSLRTSTLPAGTLVGLYMKNSEFLKIYGLDVDDIIKSSRSN